ncbi:L-dopachrome tautomerase-related protein [Chryseobacterium pennae]|uniref:L-dopachrome tautomerase-related protein n=1 Tax=Chryseobacterium pennae TaxID=2258962 RepID=UPI0014033EFA|nr:L-dopachrome tautomerase-related protein [Chryseobacterium pennae]
MKNNTQLGFLIIVLLFISNSVFAQTQNKIEIVASFATERPGNIAVSEKGRVFITMSDPTVSKFVVKEILSNGNLQNFPDSVWITKPQQYSIRGISRTIGIQVSKEILWVLDIGDNNSNPKQAPKLIGWNINTKQLHKVFTLPDPVLHPSSFLQDFVIDEKHQTAIIADMSLGGLIYPSVPAFVIIDLKTGYSRRVLENDQSFQPTDEDLLINGRPLSHSYPDGKIVNPRYPLNPIAIDAEMKWVYFGALGGEKIYRISTESLAEENLNDSQLSQQIEFYATKPKSDGFKIDNKGQIYVTDVENNAIGISTPKGYSILVQDDFLISWPDGIAIHPKGYLYFTSNQLQNKPWWNNGKDDSKPPYYVLRFKIE